MAMRIQIDSAMRSVRIVEPVTDGDLPLEDEPCIVCGAYSEQEERVLAECLQSWDGYAWVCEECVCREFEIPVLHTEPDYRNGQLLLFDL